MAQAGAVARQGERANELIQAQNAPPQNGGAAPDPRDQVIADLQQTITELNALVAKQAQDHNRLKGSHRVQLEEARTRETTLSAELEQARRAPAKAELPDVITPQERELYGDGLLNTVDRLVKARTAESTPPAKPAEAPKPAEAETEHPYMDVLRANIRNFDARNNEPGFVTWLNQPDPSSKLQRNAMLQSAFAAMDTAKVAEIFNAYAERREIGAGPPPLSPSPESSGSTAPPVPEEGTDTVKRSEMSLHYKNAAIAKGGQGPYVGKEGQKRYQQMEAKIAAALRDGKVVNG